jgi:succinyldiaminopimelate transaminase
MCRCWPRCRLSSTITEGLRTARDPLSMPNFPASRLPDFPWDVLAPYSVIAAEHPGGRIDLSVGTPVDPTPDVARRALAAASDAHGYPTNLGTDAVRQAAADWMARRLGVTIDAAHILPTMGLKEAVGFLPMLLGLGPDDHVVIPSIAYPTYEVGARLVGAKVTATDYPERGEPASLIWINSPSNPTGRVMPVSRMRELVDYARETGAVLASDECYIELGWEAQPVSVLHPDVCGGSHASLLSLHSLSKRSSMAGYRFGFFAGDAELHAGLLATRKHLGFMTPSPVQAAAAAALADDDHVEAQRARYARRRQVLKSALLQHGFAVDDSEAGLYLWATRGEPCWDTVAWLSQRGIVVAPGAFYGEGGAHHVRIALTATDADIAEAARRIGETREADHT